MNGSETRHFVGMPASIAHDVIQAMLDSGVCFFEALDDAQTIGIAALKSGNPNHYWQLALEYWTAQVPTPQHRNPADDPKLPPMLYTYPPMPYWAGVRDVVPCRALASY